MNQLKLSNLTWALLLGLYCNPNFASQNNKNFSVKTANPSKSIGVNVSDNSSIGNNKSADTDDQPVTELEPIYVKGYGFKQSIYNTSGAINVLTSKDIEKANIKTIEDLQGKVPGLFFYSLWSSGEKYIFIRGVGDFVDDYNKSVHVVIDGTPIENIGMRDLLLEDEVEQIEILKGPQNVLYGSYAKAGAIVINTKKPSRTGGVLRLGLGNDKHREAYFAYNHVFNEVFSAGASFNFDTNKGWVKNVYNDKKYGGRDFKDYAFKLSYTPTDKTSASLKYFRSKHRIDGPVLVSYDIQGDQLYSWMFPISIPYLFSGKGKPINFYEFGSNHDPITKTDNKIASLEITHVFNDNLSLVSAASYSKQDKLARIDTDLGDWLWNPIRLFAELTDNTSYKSFYQNIRLEGNYEKIKFLAGISNQRTRNDVSRQTLIGMDMGYLGYNKSRGVYSQIKYSPIQQFELTLGGRLQYDTITYQGYAEQHPIWGKLMKWGVNTYKRYVGAKINEEKVKSRKFLHQAIATWKITPTSHLYISQANSFKPAGYSPGIISSSFYEELGNVKELGYKGRLISNRLFVSAALFSMKYKGLQQMNPVTLTVDNIAKIDIKGYEIGSNFIATPELTLGLNFTKVSSKIKDYSNAALIGNKNPFFPHYTGNVNATYQKHIDLGKVTLYADYAIYGDRYGDFENEIKLKPVRLVNVSASIQKKNHEVKIWSNNLLNKKYYNMAFTQAGIDGASYGQGRTVGLQYKYRF